MAATIYVMEAVNLFAGDDDPTKSKHLTIEELKLPTLQEKNTKHHAGGSCAEIEVAVGMEALQSTFKLKGWDPDLMIQFGLGSNRRLPFTARGVIRDLRTNRAIEAVALMEGRLGKIEADAFKRGDLQGHDYMIHEIMHYELFFDNAEKIYWDFFTQDYRVNRKSVNADERRILGITGV